MFTHYMIGADAKASGVAPSVARPGRMTNMDWDDWLFWTLLLFIAPFVMGIRSIVADRRLKAQIEALTNTVTMLDHRVFRLNEQLEGSAVPGAAPPSEPLAEEPEPSAPAEIVTETSAEIPEPVVQLVAPPPSPPLPRAAAAGRSFEQRLAENWLVW